MNTPNGNLDRGDLMPKISPRAMTALLTLALIALGAENAQAQACSPTYTLAPGQSAMCAPSVAPTTPDETVRRLKGRIAYLESKIHKLEKADKDNAELYAKLKQDLKDAKKELNGKIKSLGGRIDKAEKAISGIESRLSAVEGRVTTLEGRADVVEEKTDGLVDRMNAGSRNSVGLAIDSNGSGIGEEVRVGHDFHDADESGLGVGLGVGHRFDSMGIQGCEGSINANALVAKAILEGRLNVAQVLSFALGVDAGVVAEFRGSNPNVQGGHTFSPQIGADAGVDFNLGGGVSLGAFFRVEGANLPDKAGAPRDWDADIRGGVRAGIRLPRRRSGSRNR